MREHKKSLNKEFINEFINPHQRLQRIFVEIMFYMRVLLQGRSLLATSVKDMYKKKILQCYNISTLFYKQMAHCILYKTTRRTGHV